MAANCLALLSAHTNKNTLLNLCCYNQLYPELKSQEELVWGGNWRGGDRAGAVGLSEYSVDYYVSRIKVNLIPSAYGKKAAEGKEEKNVVSCFRVSTLGTFGF